MPRKLSDEGKDFNQLRGLGFEFEEPQDEYSYQPDSGGAAGGIQGKQEYGIDSNLDSTAKRGIAESKDTTLASPSNVKRKIREIDEQTDLQLIELIRRRIIDNPYLNINDLTLATDFSSNLVVRGTVNSASEKVRLKELVEAMIGLRDFTYDVKVNASI